MTEGRSRLGFEYPDCLQASNRFWTPVQENRRCRTVFGNDPRPETVWKGRRTIQGRARLTLNLSKKPVVLFRARRNQHCPMTGQVLTLEVHSAMMAETGGECEGVLSKGR